MEAFINARKCPLHHPHDNNKLCSEYMKSDKETTETHLKSVVTSIMSSLSKDPSSTRQILTVRGTTGSSLPNYTIPTINLQKLTSLTS